MSVGRARGRLLAGVATVALLAVAACSPLPESGPVEAAGPPAPSGSAAPFDFNPPGPAAGASREEIVLGFLRALQATPISTRVAEEFLTAEAAERWRPDRRTVVYSGQRVVGRSGSPTVAVRLDATFELDRTGRWAGTGPGTPVGPQGADGSDRTLTFRLAREDGDWRIAALPDATVIPEPHFEARYREYHLPFFDPTASVLVPELVYLPWGLQAPTRLVAGLLSGPADGGRPVARTFFPGSTRLGVGVPVRNGVAEVPLSTDLLELGADELELAMAQLAWTLRQLGEVSRFQVTVDGSPIELPGGRDVADVDDWPEYAPWIASASTDLFGVRAQDTVVQVVGDSEIVAAQLPRWLRGPRSLGVDLAGQRFALVTATGTQVAVLPRGAEADTEPEGQYQGTDLLRPMWDHTGRLWLLDRTSSGSELVVRHFGRYRSISTQGLDGERVLAASMSRDGTRLLAVLEGRRSADRLVMMRVVRQASGVPVRVTPPRELSTPEPLVRVQDVGWRDPTTVAVLSRPSRTTTEVVLASTDGSSGPIDLDSDLDVLFQPGVSMASAPGPTLALYVAARDGGVHGLDVQGRWDLDTVQPGLRLPGFVG